MKVRYSYLSDQFKDADDLWADLKKFVSTGDFTLGKELSKFEDNFAKLIGTKYAIGVNSGTDAIKLSLKVLGIKAGDEVIDGTCHRQCDVEQCEWDRGDCKQDEIKK